MGGGWGLGILRRVGCGKVIFHVEDLFTSYLYSNAIDDQQRKIDLLHICNCPTVRVFLLTIRVYDAMIVIALFKK